MLVYATPEQYEASEGEWPDDADLLTRRLRDASIEVAKLTRSAVYAVDGTGAPTVTAVQGAFADATCAIVAHWQETGDPYGVDAAQGSVSIGSVSFGAAPTAGLSSLDRLAQRIGSKALDILDLAGLAGTAVAHG